MQSSITLGSTAALFTALFILAIVPGPSGITVAARSLASGFRHALAIIIGVITGDLLFITLAIYGLSTVAQTMSGVFLLVKYLGAAYLIWLALGLWRTQATRAAPPQSKNLSWLSDLLCGLLITLSDPRAILFYISFLPAYIDLSRASTIDTLIIMLSATTAVGGAKLTYALTAQRFRSQLKTAKAEKIINRVAAITLLGTGIFLLITI